MNRHYFIEGKYYGEVPATLPPFLNAFSRPRSHAFCCPVCGEIFARMPVEGRSWDFWRRPCRKHWTSANDIPGSISLILEDEYQDELPKEVLQWELERHIEWFLKVRNE